MHAQRVVLVAESEASLQLSICMTLMRMGLTAYRAGTVDAALVILGRTRVDAVVLSAQLPDSLDLLMFLRATSEYAHVPVLLYTGAALSDAAAEIAKRNGAEVFSGLAEYSILIDRVCDVLDAVVVSRR